jgi:hypothetical protein
MSSIVFSLDLHKDPDSETWAVSFIYDDKGADSINGDIIHVGTYEEMKVVHDVYAAWVEVTKPSYAKALKIVR